MSNAAARIEPNRALHTHRLGAANFTIVPHHIEHIGARLFLILQEHDAGYRLNLVPGDARFIAYCLTIAVRVADAIQMGRGTPAGLTKLITQKFPIGTATFALSVGDMPEGFRIVLVVEEYGARYELPLRTSDARLLAMCLTAGACEAEGLERTARHQTERRTAAQTPQPVTT